MDYATLLELQQLTETDQMILFSSGTDVISARMFDVSYDSESKTITIISTGVTYTTDKSLICLTLTKPFNIS